MYYHKTVKEYNKKIKNCSNIIDQVLYHFASDETKSNVDYITIKGILDDVQKQYVTKLNTFLLHRFLCNVFQRIVREFEQAVIIAHDVYGESYLNVVNSIYKDDNRLNEILRDEGLIWYEETGFSIEDIKIENISYSYISISATVSPYKDEILHDNIPTWKPSCDKALTGKEFISNLYEQLYNLWEEDQSTYSLNLKETIIDLIEQFPIINETQTDYVRKLNEEIPIKDEQFWSKLDNHRIDTRSYTVGAILKLIE